MDRSKVADLLAGIERRIRTDVVDKDAADELSEQLAELRRTINGRRKHRFYVAFEHRAHAVKIFLQMSIGAIALVLITIMMYRSLVHLSLPADDDVLTLIGQALALAAAVELAYTLFTDGPDEVLDPVLLGVSAAILLQLAKIQGFSPDQAGALALFSLSLAVLFSVRAAFIAGSDDPVSRLLRRQPGRLEP